MVVGVIVQTARSTAPTGWLLCDGTAVNRTTYADLFAILSTTFGVGDGSTTFNLPDFRGRTVMGVGTGSGLTARAMADNVGVETHILTSTEMASHTHTQVSHNHTQDSHTHSVNDPGHAHTVSSASAVHRTDSGNDLPYPGAGIGTTSSTNVAVQSIATTTAVNQSTVAVNQNAGSGSAHPNVQPSLVFNFIVKT